MMTDTTLAPSDEYDLPEEDAPPAKRPRGRAERKALRAKAEAAEAAEAARRAADDGDDEEDEGQSTLSWTLGAIGTTVAAVLMVALLALSLGSFLGYFRTDTVLSGSMRPTYKEGSVVVAMKQESMTLGVGQVIIFTPPDEPEDMKVIHRIRSVELGEDGLPVVTTKGDNNADVDPWGAMSIPNTDVFVVRGSIPYLGWVANWAQGWWPLLAGLIGAVLTLPLAHGLVKSTLGLESRAERRSRLREEARAAREAELEASGAAYAASTRLVSIEVKP